MWPTFFFEDRWGWTLISDGEFGETFLLRTSAKAGKTHVRNLKERETYQSGEKFAG